MGKQAPPSVRRQDMYSRETMHYSGHQIAAQSIRSIFAAAAYLNASTLDPYPRGLCPRVSNPIRRQ